LRGGIFSGDASRQDAAAGPLYCPAKAINGFRDDALRPVRPCQEEAEEIALDKKASNRPIGICQAGYADQHVSLAPERRDRFGLLAEVIPRNLRAENNSLKIPASLGRSVTNPQSARFEHPLSYGEMHPSSAIGPFCISPTFPGRELRWARNPRELPFLPSGFFHPIELPAAAMHRVLSFPCQRAERSGGHQR
jgi:hypothetical protein